MVNMILSFLEIYLNIFKYLVASNSILRLMQFKAFWINNYV